MSTSVDKWIGCLVGLAVGDTLGSLAQGRRGPGFPAPSLRLGMHPKGRPALYMIDTQRALLVAESLAAHREGDPEDLCRRFVRMAHGPDHLPLGGFRGPGRNFRTSINRLRTGWTWKESGSDSPGIGAAARIAPVGLVAKDREALMESIIRLSLPTHRDPRAIAAAACVASLIHDEIHQPGAPESAILHRLKAARRFTRQTEEHLHRHFPEVLSLDYSPLLHQMSTLLNSVEQYLSLDEDEAMSRISGRVSDLYGEPVSATSGLCVAGVSAAVWFACAHEFRFGDAVAAVCRVGGHTSSIGAVVGAICGCAKPDTIPHAWRDSLLNVDQIAIRALQLAGEEVRSELVRDFYESELTWTEHYIRDRKQRKPSMRSPSVSLKDSDELFGVRFVSGRVGDPCVFFFDGNLDLCGLFDVGRTFSLRPGDVRRLDHLLVTHTHIDHFIGFDHILRHSLNRPNVLNIFGPVKITNQIQHRLRSYVWNLRRRLRLDVRTYEVDQETLTVSELSMRDAFAKRNTLEPRTYEGVIFNSGDYLFRAAILEHGMPCLGYAVEEPTQVRVDKEKLRASGLRPGPWLNQLKAAWQSGRPEECELDVFGQRYDASSLGDLLISSKGRKVAYVVDTAFTDVTRERIADLARDADLFICEASFSEQLDLEQAKKKSHLTARQAGILAREAGVKRLHIFHFSRRYQINPEILIREAKEAAEGIQVTY